MTKNTARKLLADVDEVGGVTRYLVACLTALKLIQKTPDGGRTFVDPATFSHLEVLKRPFVGRLKWLLLGK